MGCVGKDPLGQEHKQKEKRDLCISNALLWATADHP